MQFTKKCRETADACRFCWMCRHICPIGNVTGQERNTARARALSLSLVARNAARLEGDLVDNLYECALCGACTADCLTGFDPVVFTREARREAVIDGTAPAYITALLEKYAESGSIYGKALPDAELDAAAARHAKKTDTLFYIGETARRFGAANAARAIALLEKAGVAFTVAESAEKEPVSGRSLYFLCGDTSETRAAMETAAKLYSGFGSVVFYDSGDAKCAMQEAKELGIGLAPATAYTFPAFILELIRSKKLSPAKNAVEYTFQDPAALARGLEDSKSAREVLAACGETKELLLCGKNTVLCGDMILAQYIPETVALLAKKRWQEAANVGAKLLVTADTAEYAALSENKPENSGVMTLEEVVLKCL